MTNLNSVEWPSGANSACGKNLRDYWETSSEEAGL